MLYWWYDSPEIKIMSRPRKKREKEITHKPWEIMKNYSLHSLSLSLDEWLCEMKCHKQELSPRFVKFDDSICLRN